MANVNTRFGSGLITLGGIYAAGTTNYKAQTGSAATNLNRGEIRAAGTLKAPQIIGTTGISSAGTINAASGFNFAAGNYKKFAAGTYIGAGSATAAITSTGLTTVHHVFMSLRGAAYGSGATQDGRIICAPVLAAGTTGSFYPRVYKSGATNKEVYPNAGVGATFSWMAVGV